MADPLTPSSDPLAPSYKPDPAAMSPGGATSVQVVGGLKEQIAGARKVMGEVEETRNAGIQALAKTREAQEKERHENELKRLELQAEQPVPEKPTEAPHQNQTDAMKAWGSAAMMISMMGSLLTRAPMTSALNAASKAIDAFHQNDIDAYNTAFKQWQVESTNAEKMFQHQQAAYEKLLAQADRHENETDQHYAKRISDMERELTWIATSFKDEKSLLALGVSGYKGIEQAIAVEKSFFAKMTAEADAMVRTNPQRVASMGVLGDPQYQEAVAVLTNPKASREDKIKAASTIRTMGASIGPSFQERIQKQATDEIIKQEDYLNTKDPIGKLYGLFKSSDIPQVIERANEQLKKHQMIDVYTAAALKDAFTKAATGGQAIRVGMLKMVEQNKPLYDEMNDTFNRLYSGSGLNPNQATRLIKYVNEYYKNAQYNFAQKIEQTASQMDDLYRESNGLYGDQLRKNWPELTSGVMAIHNAKKGGPTARSETFLSVVGKSEKFPFGNVTKSQYQANPGAYGWHPVTNAKAIVESMYPGSSTSWVRKPGDRSFRSGSWHGTGAAVDVKPIKGMTFEQYVKSIQSKGYVIISALDEQKHPVEDTTGPNWHVVIGQRNG